MSKLLVDPKSVRGCTVNIEEAEETVNLITDSLDKNRVHLENDPILLDEIPELSERTAGGILEEREIGIPDFHSIYMGQKVSLEEDSDPDASSWDEFLNEQKEIIIENLEGNDEDLQDIWPVVSGNILGQFYKIRKKAYKNGLEHAEMEQKMADAPKKIEKDPPTPSAPPINQPVPDIDEPTPKFRKDELENVANTLFPLYDLDTEISDMIAGGFCKKYNFPHKNGGIFGWSFEMLKMNLDDIVKYVKEVPESEEIFPLRGKPPRRYVLGHVAWNKSRKFQYMVDEQRLLQVLRNDFASASQK
ncbi:TPA: Phosphoprotein [Anole lyssa-like virus 1]|uniref:Phosphoprotein n=1 Tax=Anole lyssa-like virus 1 TaxID=2772344 RepID=A0AAD3AVK2_9RHAB|nr:Phosphoprotein [Anole lyssa-like virus 1]FAA01389.1 TPA: Phosphoprotein [Anole lyssa-like virus 1]